MMDDRQSEELKCQIAETRSNLAEKLETLEQRVVEPAADTVIKVKEAVENTAEVAQNTMNKVTETFDLATHVRNYPWRMMGAGVATGFLLGHCINNNPRSSNARTARSSSSPVHSKPEAFRSNGRDHSHDPPDEARGPIGAEPQQWRTDSKSSPAGWNKLTTEIQGMVIHALVPVFQGLLAAVLAEFFRHKAQPASTAEESSKAAGHHLEDTDHDWTAAGIESEPVWGGRLRSTPK